MMYEVGQQLGYDEMHWYCDNNGYEVGYPHIPVVGTYGIIGTDLMCLINSEDGTILELLEGDDE